MVMKKTLSVLYGVASYMLFLGAFLYLVAFMMNLTPRSVSGPVRMSPITAAAIDVALIALFGLQHSVMARPGFKQWWTRLVPKHVERSTFVLVATLLLTLVVAAWQPIEGEIWNIGGAPMVAILAISLMGWLAVPAVSFLTDHFELFGLRQVFTYAMGREEDKPEFKERAVYKKVRHPMMLGFLVAMWATPLMTASHALFAGLMSAYILVGIYFEERDLVRAHGQAYRDYQARVPKLVPGACADRDARAAMEHAMLSRMQ
jgi:protein-S-isoprenylcysteine O-methyltransferase Ste14